jgi:cytochrome d ubiquinol oxidase subunit I
MVFVGSWLSGFFILATNAWMQHPVAYSVAADDTVQVNDFWGLLANPWLLWQYTHNMTAAAATGAFVMTAVGAYYQLSASHLPFARTFLRTGIITAALASAILLYPTGHGSSVQVFESQPVTGAAFEGHFDTQEEAGLVVMGQPNMDTLTLDNPLVVPGALSYLLYGHVAAEVKGLRTFPRGDWPDNVPLLYYSYHVMAGLGTIFIGTTLMALVLLWQGRLFTTRWLLWILMLLAPFPYIATTAGWMTAELGRQPWLVYGLFRTAEGASPLVHSGNALFTLLGFLGLYLLLGLLFVLLFVEIVLHGPATGSAPYAGSVRGTTEQGVP